MAPSWALMHGVPNISEDMGTQLCMNSLITQPTRHNNTKANILDMIELGYGWQFF